MNRVRPLVLLCVVSLVASLVVAGCSDDGSSSGQPTTPTTGGQVSSTDAPTTSAAPDTVAPTTAPPTTAPPDTTPPDDPVIAGYREVVETLADDTLDGRDNLTDASLAAQAYLIEQLREFAQPIDPAAGGDAGYRQEFAQGVNLLAVIPGAELPDEYVIVGAHYDHLGNVCENVSASDRICNGAVDNATGVAAALAIGRSLAAGPQPRRSVVIALWDAEEDGLLGSAAYLDAPLVPVAQTVGYVNFDIQGTSMSPALTNITVMVGAETGGQNLLAAALAASQASSLDTMPLSLLFGQGRSDHANFTAAGVPSVFFTDATPPCYHTVGDDISIVDYPKLVQQVATAEALTRDLASTDALPVFDAAAPPASYDDAVSMLHVVSAAEPDFPRFSNADQAGAAKFLADLQGIVDAGPAAFGGDAIGILLNGSLLMVNAWATGPCEAFFME
ncbi:MAG: M28 family peptidase [Actinomycetota bacterium]|nr:M28 family peptidase [Actinomycetota bacterium]